MNYRDFRRHCLKSRQSILSMHCGSAFELPIKYFMSNPTDSDRLIYAEDICAIPENRNPPKNFKGTVLTIESADNHPGFARLKHRNYGHRPTYFLRPKLLCSDTNNGPAVEIDQVYRLPLKLKIGLQFFNRRWCHMQGIKTDMSYSVYCPYWPPEAQEWLTRKRQNGWPDETLIARVKKGGCHFVSKPHQNNLEDKTQWRFSFSKAELILIHSWIPAQKEVYHMLRLIKDKITDKCGGSDQTTLRTYHFKTLMLWACEQKPSEFWDKNTITACVHDLVNRMIRNLKAKHCPNYFISENNMLDFLDDKNDFTKEIKILERSVEHECTDPAAKNIAALQSNSCFSVSNKLQELLFLSLRSNVFPLHEKLNGPLRDILYKCECFLPELQQLYSALEADVRLMSIKEVSDRRISNDYSVAYSGYTTAINASTDERAETLDFNFSRLLNWSGKEHLQRMALWPLYFHRKLSESSCNTCELSTYQGGVEFSECDMLTTESSNERDSSSFIRQFIAQTSGTFCMKQFAKDSSKHIPSSMYLMSAAYLTNFYYNTMKDHEKTLSLCAEIYKSFSEFLILLENYIYTVANLPMLIATDFSTLFDDNVRTVLGFILLCKASSSCISPKDLRKVVFPLSPIRFIRYVEFQSSLDTDGNVPRVFAYTPYDLEHEVPCTSTTVCFSEVFLSAAMRCRGVKILRISSKHNKSLTSFGEVLGRVRCLIQNDVNFDSQYLVSKLNNRKNASEFLIRLKLLSIGFVLAESQASDLVLYFHFQSTDNVKFMESRIRSEELKTLVENCFNELLNQRETRISVSVEWFPGDYERCINGFNHN